MTVHSFLDWIDAPDHLVDHVTAEFALETAPTDMLRRYARFVAGDRVALKADAPPVDRDTRWMLDRSELAILDRLATRSDGLRIGVSVDRSGLVAVAVRFVEDAETNGARTLQTRARTAALLVVNVLSHCLSGNSRFEVGFLQDTAGTVIPTTAVWPVEVAVDPSRAKNKPELWQVKTVMRHALDGKLKSVRIARTAPGWTPADQHVRPAIDALVQRTKSSIERHVQRLEGTHRENLDKRYRNIVIRPTGILLEELYKHVTGVAIGLAIIWFALMGTTLALKSNERFSMTVAELRVWTVCLSVATGALLWAVFKTEASSDGRKARVHFLFRSKLRVWMPLALLACIAAIMILVHDWGVLAADVRAKLDAWSAAIPALEIARGLIGAALDNMTALLRKASDAIPQLGAHIESDDKTSPLPADYKRALRSLIWVLPVPLLVTLAQARVSFGRIIAQESKLQRQRAVVARLQDVAHEGQRSATRLAALAAQIRVNTDNGEADPVSVDSREEDVFKDLFERLRRTADGYKSRQDEAQRQFQARTGVAALLAVVATVLQNAATFQPFDQRSSPRDLRDQMASVAAMDNGCKVDLPKFNSFHAESLNAAALMRIFGCIDAAETAAVVRAETTRNTLSEFATRLNVIEVALRPPVLPALAAKDACLGPRRLGCVTPQGEDSPDPTTLASLTTDAQALATALKAARDDMAALGQNVPNAELAASREVLADIATQLAALEDRVREFPNLSRVPELDVTEFVDNLNIIEARIAGVPDLSLGVTLTTMEPGAIRHILETCPLYGEHRFADGSSHLAPDGGNGTGWFYEDAPSDFATIRDSFRAAQDGSTRFYVLGSADPKGGEPGNITLSKKRAAVVAEHLVATTDGTSTHQPVTLALGANGWIAGRALPRGNDDPAYRTALIHGCEDTETTLADGGDTQ